MTPGNDTESLIERLRRAWRKLNGWHDCPLCGEQKLWWLKVTVVFDDEPPMFGRWLCNGCGGSTDVLPTELTERAARNLGYRGFAEMSAARAALTPKQEDAA